MNYTKHEDDRRTLYDWANGNFKSAKAIVIKKSGTVIGGHHHERKDEKFFLLQGEFSEMQLGDNIFHNLKAPCHVIAPRGVFHKFTCEAGSILLGVATEPFDGKDEIVK